MKFKTVILQTGNNTGIEVPESIVEALQGGKRPAVIVTLNGYTYPSTVAVMGGKFLIPLSAEHRNSAGVKGGDELEIILDPDTVPRVVALPDDLERRLKENLTASSFFEKLSPSAKKKLVLLVDSAKTTETRNKRLEKVLGDLEKGIKP